ncbi:Rieske 2Fe-2S domain-containing protein [Ramlibacter monticola]|uniref:Twin-arginine translocation signal domain-containing protein n=1 Tax=Ramlibacter monticola TaxID=1926872 RepID=A0A936YX46_9BURK|nr:twin-arginine translocation signal domain-containing protein [Ramlibacter monticola]MBL0389617.1 twin-arginine translocation signal domain-containing protein [Ramlibacter monticola]
MDRRSFLESCSAGAACLSGGFAPPAWAANARPKDYAQVLLVNERGDPLRASELRPQANYVFHYPFEATPVFLLDLGKPLAPHALSTADRAAYTWPGGVGRNRSIVAFSAICAHQLVYPTKEVSFISYRKTRAQRGVQDGLIHCCAEHSQYDPSRGAEVLSGPAKQPLCAVLLTHDPRADTLTAYGTLGAELFDEFFRKYEVKLSFEMGPKAKTSVAGQSVVRELEKFCRNPVQC